MYSILAAVIIAAAPAVSSTGSHRIEDDYGRAVAEARARNVPLVVDVWAPW